VGIFQRTFSFVLPSQVSGRFVASECPDREGPRHCGQFSAVTKPAEKRKITTDQHNKRL
jgi:hypothetical protein